MLQVVIPRVSGDDDLVECSTVEARKCRDADILVAKKLIKDFSEIFMRNLNDTE